MNMCLHIRCKLDIIRSYIIIERHKILQIYVDSLNGTRKTYEQIDSHGRYVRMQFDIKYAEQYLKEDVSERFYNKKQTDSVVASVSETGMSTKDLENILKTDIKPKGWRVGEYIAITAMEKFFKAKLYHDPNRETTSPNAILAGPDLVGTTRLKDVTVFLIGEVKTSSSTSSPPNVMYDLISELDGLGDIYGERAKAAIKWMILHKKEYDEGAINAALENYRRRKITGVLVRDTIPNRNDMLQGYVKLLSHLSEDIFLLMVALYMPIKIDDFNRFLVM